MLTQVERISKKTILAAGLRPELTFTSLVHHGGATEIQHVRPHRNAVDDQGSMVFDGSDGKLPAR
jgi:hypothetical protein